MATIIIPTDCFTRSASADFVRESNGGKEVFVVPEVEMLRLIIEAQLEIDGKEGSRAVPCTRVSAGRSSECRLCADWGYDPEEDYEYLHCVLSGPDGRVLSVIC